MPVIIPELHFFEIQRELLFGDAVKFDQPFLGVAPKSFEAINIDLARREALPMINTKMTIAAEHKSIITPELIRVYDRPATDCFDGHVEQGLSCNIFNNFNLDCPVTLQDAENRHFSGCPATTLPFAPSTEVAFIQLDFASKEQFWIPTGKNGKSDDRDCLQYRGIAQSDLLSDFPCRDFEFKEFDDPQPLLERDVQLIDTPVREVVEGVFTSFTAVSSADDPIGFSASTACTKNRPVFPTRFFKKSRARFSDLVMNSKDSSFIDTTFYHENGVKPFIIT